MLNYVDELMYEQDPANYVQPMQQVPMQQIPMQPVQQVPVAQPNLVPVQQVQTVPAPINYVQPMQQQAMYQPQLDPANYVADVELGPMTITPVNEPKNGEEATSVYQNRWKSYKQSAEENARSQESPEGNTVYAKRWEAAKGGTGKPAKGEVSGKIPNLVPVPQGLSGVQQPQQQQQGLKDSTFSQMQKKRQSIDAQSRQLINKGISLQEAAAKEKGKMYDALKKGLDTAYKNEIDQVQNLRDGYKDKEKNLIKGFNQRFNDLMKDLDNQYKEYGKEKIDNNRLFNNMSTGRRVLVGIGLFMSAFSNEAMKNSLNLIENAINRDINAQKDEIKRGRFGITGKQNQLKLLSAKYNDDITAANALSLLQKRKVIDTIDAQLRRAETDADRGKLKLLKSKLLQSMKPNIQKMSEIQLRQIDTANKMQYADPIEQMILAKTSLLPKDKSRDDALGELSEFRDEENALRQVDSVYSSFMNKDTSSALLARIPFTKSKAQQLAAFARMFGPIKSLINEAVTTGELKVFYPLIPRHDDREEVLRQKMYDFKQALINRFKPKTKLNLLLPPSMKRRHRFIKEKEAMVK